MSIKKIVTGLALSLLLSSGMVSAADNAKCAVTEKGAVDAKIIYEEAEEYRQLLKRINAQAFKDVVASPSTVASLMEEKLSLEKSYGWISSAAYRIYDKTTTCAGKDWVHILYLTADSIRYMEDMARFDLVKECKVYWLSKYHTMLARDNLLEKF